MEIAQEKYRKFFTRSVWGSLMIIVFAAILYLGHAFVSLFVMLIQVMVFKEMIAVRYIEAKERKISGFRTLHWFILFATLFYVNGPQLLSISSTLLTRFGLNLDFLSRTHLLISFILYVIGFIAFIFTLKRGSLKYQFSQLTWTLMTLLIVIGQSNFIIQNIWKGLIWFLLPCSLIICNDIMAYMCGLVAGRRFIDRPLTKLSPNKTWEGFVGALICTLIWSFLFSKVLAQYDWFICPKEDVTLLGTASCVPNEIFLPHTYQLPTSIVPEQYSTFTVLPVQLHALVFALFASLIAPFGGFFASGIKRAYRIKDFDSIFPGHGGVTDRMDCQFIMGLFTYVYYTVVIATPIPQVANVVKLLSHMSTEDQLAVYNHLKNLLKA